MDFVISQVIKEKPYDHTIDTENSYKFKLPLLLFSPSVYVQLFVTPWIAACQVSLSFNISRSLLKLMSIEMVMPSSHLFLCFPLLLLPSVFPSINGFFPVGQLFTSAGQSIGVSASASVFPMNIQYSFLLGWTGWISLGPRVSQESSLISQFKSINSSALNLLL